MFILIIARGYPSNQYPLNGIFEFDQAEALNRLGHKVIYASIDLRSVRRWRKWGINYFQKSEIEIYNISLPLGRIYWKVQYLIGKLALLVLYKVILKNNGKPDIIHAHFTLVSAIASILKKREDIPFVVTVHNSNINKNVIRKRDYLLGEVAFKNADKVISVSSALSKKIMQHFGIITEIVPNIVNTSCFTFNGEKFNAKFTYISVGNLNHNKGYDLLIEAFHDAKFDKNVNLLIVGSGYLKYQLQCKIDSFGLKNQIFLLGSKCREEVGKLMHKSKVFVLASRSETFGLVYIEAMLSGLPVIATCCGGPEDFINENNGILIPINNVQCLVDALIFMYNNIDIYDNAEISKSCFSKFSPKEIGFRLSNIYNEILNQKS